MPSPNENQRAIVLIIVLIIWITANDNSAGFVQAPSLTRARLTRQRNSHGVLNTTNWGDFSPQLAGSQQLFPGTEPRYLNLTGFREEDGFAWDDLGRFRNRCEEWSRNAVGEPSNAAPVWQNVSGVVRGPWIRKQLSVSRTHSSYNLSKITPGIEWVGSAVDWSRNITGREGKMLVRIHDDEDAGTEPTIEGTHGQRQPLPVEIKARAVSATVTIDDEDGSGSSSEMKLHGVHWPRQGALLLTTTSEKFAGIFGLPHLTSRQEYFESSKALLNRTLDEVLRVKERRYFIDHGNPWASNSDSSGGPLGPSPHCEYLFYMQAHAPDKSILNIEPSLTGPENLVKAIEELEHELRFPQGAPQDGPPRLQVSAVVYSPDCAFMLETKGPPESSIADGQHLSGWKQERWLHDVGHWMLGFGAVIFCQVHLLKVQMREASTPSTLGRISFYTVSMILLADGVIFAGSAAWALSASTTLLPALVMTGASFLASMVGTCFLSEIYLVQEPEWRRRDRERQNMPTTNTPRPPATPAPASTPAGNAAAETTETNTILSTAARRAVPHPPSPPIIIPSDQDIDAEIEENMNNRQQVLPTPVTAPNTTNNQNTNQSTPLGTIFGQLIMSGIAILFLSLAAATWRPILRSAYFNILAFVYLSLWIPQIYRNIYRNCRRALSWRFVIGQSVLRILPIAYFYLFKDNFAFAATDWTAFAVLAGWLWVQIWILTAQNVLGPRFGVPKGWMPEAWEYHPILREDGVESGGLPIGLVLGSSESAPNSPGLERTKSGDAGKHTRIHSIDCAICREVLEVPVVKAGESDPSGGVSGVFARRVYMVTPCRHIFHSACLEGWMRFRLQCPICREELPPL